MSNLNEENFEDRKGSDYELGKGANLEKIENRKYGFKPSDTFAKKILKLRKKDVIEEKKKIEQEPTNNDDEISSEDDDETVENKKELFDPNEEKRIAVMQHLNPRVLKSKEKKNYMNKTEIQEQLSSRLNAIVQEKLDLLKTAIAMNLPYDLDEAKSPKVVEFSGYDGSKGWKASNPYTKKVQYFGAEFKDKAIEFAHKGAPQSAAEILADHEALHTQSVKEETEQLEESNVIKQGRTKIIKARVRGGKVQRRKRLSAVKGYTIRGGKLKRMSPQERMRRKRAAKRAKIKRKAKMARALMRRKRSMRKRAALGIKE